MSSATAAGAPCGLAAAAACAAAMALRSPEPSAAIAGGRGERRQSHAHAVESVQGLGALQREALSFHLQLARFGYGAGEAKFEGLQGEAPELGDDALALRSDRGHARFGRREFGFGVEPARKQSPSLGE